MNEEKSIDKIYEIDFKKVDLDKYNSSIIDKLDEVINELKEANTRENLAEERYLKEKEVEKASEKEVSTDELILAELKNLNKFNADNLDVEQKEKINNLIVKIEKDYDSFNLTQNTVLFYGLVGIPIVLFLIFIYRFLKSFIW